MDCRAKAQQQKLRHKMRSRKQEQQQADYYKRFLDPNAKKCFGCKQSLQDPELRHVFCQQCARPIEYFIGARYHFKLVSRVVAAHLNETPDESIIFMKSALQDATRLEPHHGNQDNLWTYSQDKEDETLFEDIEKIIQDNEENNPILKRSDPSTCDEIA